MADPNLLRDLFLRNGRVPSSLHTQDRGADKLGKPLFVCKEFGFHAIV